MSDKTEPISPPTIADVAERARVAPSTASVVLRDRPEARVSPATRERILEAAKVLNYCPNPVARSLRCRKTRTVGLVINKVRWYECLEFIIPIEEFFRSHRHHVVVAFSALDAEEERRHVEEMARGWVDGLLLQPVGHADLGVFDRYAALKTPIVLLEGPDGSRLPCVKKNRQEGVRRCVRHLHGLGRRHIGLALASLEDFQSRERIEGYHEALTELALPDKEELLFASSDPTGDCYEMGKAMTEAVLSRTPPMDAIICANDLIAMGLMYGLRERGLDLPRELSVVGFNNMSGMQNHFIPLTSVEQHYEDVARNAAELLWHLMNTERNGAPRTVSSTPDLVVRESCGAGIFARSSTDKGDRGT